MVLASKVGASARRSGDGMKGASYTILTIKDLEIKQAALVGDVSTVMSTYWAALDVKMGNCVPDISTLLDMVVGRSPQSWKPPSETAATSLWMECSLSV